MPRMAMPSAICSAAVGSERPIRAPAIEVTELMSVNGIASRTLARPLLRSDGAADSAAASLRVMGTFASTVSALLAVFGERSAWSP